MENNEVIEFVQISKTYCHLIESLNKSNVLDEVPSISMVLSELYSKALKLPEVETDSDELPDITVNRPKLSFGKYECYWEVFEAYTLEEATTASLSDDILDIYQDIKEGLLLYESNEKNEAIWHWNFHFQAHWGNHAVDSLRALHSIMFGIKRSKFQERYFYIRSKDEEKFIKWDTVEGIINDDVIEDDHIISDLMIQDIRDKYGQEYEVWEIKKEEYERKVTPRTK